MAPAAAPPVAGAAVAVAVAAPPPTRCLKHEHAEVKEAVAVNSARKVGMTTPVGEARKDVQKGVASGLNRNNARSSLSSKQTRAVDVGADENVGKGISPTLRFAQFVTSARTLKPMATQVSYVERLKQKAESMQKSAIRTTASRQIIMKNSSSGLSRERAYTVRPHSL